MISGLTFADLSSLRGEPQRRMVQGAVGAPQARGRSGWGKSS
jgi:hypothetical protein